MYKIAVLDDDYQFLQNLKVLLKPYVDQCKFVYFVEPAKLIEHADDFDAIFSDFDMPDLNAFDLFEKVSKMNSTVVRVVISNFEGYVSSGYNYGIFRYVNKNDVDKEITVMMEELLYVLKKKHRKLIIQSCNQMVALPIREITHIESDKNYVIIYCKKQYRIRSTFGSMLEKIKDDDFCVPVYGTAVNMNEIRYVNKSSLTIVMKSGEEFQISNKKKKELFENYMEFRLQ